MTIGEGGTRPDPTSTDSTHAPGSAVYSRVWAVATVARVGHGARQGARRGARLGACRGARLGACRAACRGARRALARVARPQRERHLGVITRGRTWSASAAVTRRRASPRPRQARRRPARTCNRVWCVCVCVCAPGCSPMPPRLQPYAAEAATLAGCNPM
eukprot:scaffold49838_cov48-Phaeocystis_antarctica.AAC.2